MRNTKIRLLAEAAVMLALAIALSYIKIWDMPMGGSVTLLSMLPIILIAVKNGTGWGVGTAFVFSLFQLLQGVMSGNVFPYCQTLAIVILCVAFDYIVPFTVLGFAAVGKKKFGMAVDKRKIALESDIKAFGTYEFELKLHTKVSTKMKVMVTEG